MEPFWSQSPRITSHFQSTGNLTLMIAFGWGVPPDKDVVRDGIPGVVNAGE